MKRAVRMLVAAFVLAALVLAAPGARAEEADSAPQGESEAETPSSDAPSTETPPRGPRRFVGRLGALGAYRGLYDLSILGGGLALSAGGEGDKVGGHANFHFFDGRTEAGLVVVEFGVTGTAEWRLGDGWRFGLGGGWTYFSIQRATDHSTLQSVGPTGIVRFGYDFCGDCASRPGVYILLSLEGQLQSGGSDVWGPTLETGLRF